MSDRREMFLDLGWTIQLSWTSHLTATGCHLPSDTSEHTLLFQPICFLQTPF